MLLQDGPAHWVNTTNLAFATGIVQVLDDFEAATAAGIDVTPRG